MNTVVKFDIYFPSLGQYFAKDIDEDEKDVKVKIIEVMNPNLVVHVIKKETRWEIL